MNIEKVVSFLSQSNLSEFLLDCFQGSYLEDLAKETRFVERRTSQLTGAMFLALNISDFSNQGGMSLTEKCEYLYENYGIEMKKQSLDERYNTFAVKFMRMCFEQSFAHFSADMRGIKGVSSHFKAVFLSDATSFQLPASLADFYPSNGGDTSGASVKIHQSYELLKGEVVDFDITNGKDPDVTYWQRTKLEFIADALYLADLGYYKLKHFKAIAKAGAYWLSRYKTGTKLYLQTKEGNYTPLDLDELIANQGDTLELAEVYVGKEEHLCARLVIEAVPQDVREKRLKKLKARVNNASKKYQASSLKVFLCGYNVFLTNVPKDKLTSKDVVAFYGLRWQIELLFKVWKSLLAIDKIGKMSIFRFECYLYGKFILLLLTTQIKSFLEQENTTYQLELSEWKTVKYLKKSQPVV